MCDVTWSNLYYLKMEWRERERDLTPERRTLTRLASSDPDLSGECRTLTGERDEPS